MYKRLRLYGKDVKYFLEIFFLTFEQYKTIISIMEINTKKIKQIMKQRGLSTMDMAIKMNVKESWVYAVLAGTAGKTFKTVTSFADALGVPDKDIIK